ncbi:MAG: methyltransferase domain-containing protein [Streptosporangiales bacterium]|nr:methyltransferase domain-containing protein [Streptosporangiales bacterium]
MSETPERVLQRVYNLQGVDEAEEVYDEWAGNYDADTVDGLGYLGPGLAAARLADVAPGVGVVLDAGCGTGLAGVALNERLSVTIDGADISEGMLERARGRGVYRNLVKTDLTRPLEFADDSYDAVLCVGTLTDGHVGPAAFDEFVRVVRAGGVVVATVLARVWESGGYKAHLDGMAERGVVTVREADEHPIFDGPDGATCRLCVVEVNSTA